MTSNKSESIGTMRDHASQLFQTIIEQATSRAMSETRSTAGWASRKVRSTRSSSSPSVRDIALNAASGAIELWQAAKDKAESTAETVQSGVTDAATEIRHGAAEIKDGAADRVHLVTSSVGDTAHRAVDSGKAAAVTSAKTGRSAVELVIWTGAAGAIAYYAFLNDARREKARALAMKAINEGRAILNDLQGSDGTFT